MSTEYATWHDRMRACGLFPELHVGKFVYGIANEEHYRVFDEIRVTHCDRGTVESEKIIGRDVMGAVRKIEERMGGRHKTV